MRGEFVDSVLKNVRICFATVAIECAAHKVVRFELHQPAGSYNVMSKSQSGSVDCIIESILSITTFGYVPSQIERRYTKQIS